ncbi:histone-fold-containing protein [Ramicandelaber brevisporus]|nr:histone-fold-containing protein [Ramicandelaber brevisporus]
MNDDFDNQNDDELTLPRSTVARMVQEYMPSDLTCTKEAKDLIGECCTEFIHLLATQATEQCEKSSKKTITADHVLDALKALGYESYLPALNDVLEEHKGEEQREKQRKQQRMPKTGGLSQEELEQKQLEMLAQSRERFNAQQAPLPPS